MSISTIITGPPIITISVLTLSAQTWLILDIQVVSVFEDTPDEEIFLLQAFSSDTCSRYELMCATEFSYFKKMVF